MAKKLKEGTNPLAEIDDGLSPGFQRRSEDLIYESVMRGGGEPFGEPYGIGISSLTEKIVNFFKQKSFFGFETMEKARRKRNKFTRYGSSRYFGAYQAVDPNRRKKKRRK